MWRWRNASFQNLARKVFAITPSRGRSQLIIWSYLICLAILWFGGPFNGLGNHIKQFLVISSFSAYTQLFFSRHVIVVIPVSAKCCRASPSLQHSRAWGWPHWPSHYFSRVFSLGTPILSHDLAFRYIPVTLNILGNRFFF